jgi:hypothetical protein
MSQPLALMSSAASATTYSFATTGEGHRSWALCTVNDATGELLITSDWGSWSHRWDAHPNSLGAPSLTAFIGDRGDVDYLARKLQREGRNGRVFSASETARSLRRRLCGRRLQDGRGQIAGRLEADDLVDGAVPGRLRDRFTEDGLPIFGDLGEAYERLPFLSRAEARRIWEAIGALALDIGDHSSGDLFWDRLSAIDGFLDHVTEQPWDYAQTVQTAEDRALRSSILPALIAACRDAIRK